MNIEISVKKIALQLAINNLKRLEDGTGRLSGSRVGPITYSSGNTPEQIAEAYKALLAIEEKMIDIISKTGLAMKFALQKFSDADNTGEFKDIGSSLGGGYSGASGVRIGRTYIDSYGDSWAFFDVPLEGQHVWYKCGSACGSMILTSLGYQVSEEEFWNYGGYTTCVGDITRTLNHFIGEDVYRYVNTRNMSLDEYAELMNNSLKNGYPVQVVANIPSGTEFGYGPCGHYFIVTGVYRNSNGELMAKINDPFSGSWYSNGHQGQQLEMKLSDIKEYNSNHSGLVICN